MIELRQHEGSARLKPRSRIGIFPGRSIAFSPEWRDDGLCVLFDRNSGDYWVVSELARKIVENVTQDEGCDSEELAQLVLYALSHDQRLDATPDSARNVIDELLRLEILVSGPHASLPPVSAGHPLD